MTRRSIIPLLLTLSLAACTAVKVVTHSVEEDPVAAPAGHYQLDPHHWSIVFDVDHLHYARFVMRFDKATASLDFQPREPEKSRASATIDAASVDTNLRELDRLVTGGDMLEAARYPEIRFESTMLKRTGKNSGEMTGRLTVHGATIPVTLAVTFNGAAPNPLTGVDTLGFTATGSFDRTKLGLGTWVPAVGRDIRVTIQAEFVRTSA